MAIRSVRLRQSGGFAGLVRSSEMPAADLTPAEARALQDHLDDKARDARAVDAKDRDLVTFELEIETDAGTRSFEFDEANTPTAIKALIERLSKKSRPARP